jgi:N-methylhydantoinase A
MVDIHTIGAGGGSIAWFDRDGLLKVGPLSAGADPGPACYGRGSVEATVTDANLVLGRLSARGLIGGRMPLDLNAARNAIAPIAKRLDFSIERTAVGIIEIVVANMVRAIRTVSVERGHDPRNYCLLPFGGAGPLHASEVARALGISRFLLPKAPGILCAQGLIASDLKDDIVRSTRVRLESRNLATVRKIITDLRRKAEAWFEHESVKQADRKVQLSFDMRYVGQNFELLVPVGSAIAGRLPALPSLEHLRKQFYLVHDRFYGFHSKVDPIEIVAVRMTARAAIARLSVSHATRRYVAKPKPIDHRPVWFPHSRPLTTAVYDRSQFRNGQVIRGPAIIEQFDSTTVLYPKDRLTVESNGNLLVKVSP